jgi:hypothetical protein
MRGRGPTWVVSIPGYSAFAPETLTARARLALSIFRKASKPSGELPTTS